MQDLRVVFLGTAAGTPSRERNVSSVAIALDGSVLLFDCGEATQHQLLRSPLTSGSIDAVFLSHLHGDHVYGLPGLLATMSMNARQRPLDVFGPQGTDDYVASVLRTTHHHPLFEVRVHCSAEPSREELYRGRGFTVTASLLDHCVPSLGFCVIEDDFRGRIDVAKAQELGVPPGPLFGQLQRGEDVRIGDRVVHASDIVGPPRRGRRVVFCGDTRPCPAAVELARDADLLIHEATYDNSLTTEAGERFHSTAAGAARVAAEAGVRRLILTHFSTRYSEVGLLLEEARAIFPATDAASDLASFEVVKPA